MEILNEIKDNFEGLLLFNELPKTLVTSAISAVVVSTMTATPLTLAGASFLAVARLVECVTRPILEAIGFKKNIYFEKLAHRLAQFGIAYTCLSTVLNPINALAIMGASLIVKPVVQDINHVLFFR